MKEFRAFPPTYIEVDGEILPSYQSGNNNEPKYPRYDTIHDCVDIEFVEES